MEIIYKGKTLSGGASRTLFELMGDVAASLENPSDAEGLLLTWDKDGQGITASPETLGLGGGRGESDFQKLMTGRFP